MNMDGQHTMGTVDGRHTIGSIPLAADHEWADSGAMTLV
jgi:hypothetical protein